MDQLKRHIHTSCCPIYARMMSQHINLNSEPYTVNNTASVKLPNDQCCIYSIYLKYIQLPFFLGGASHWMTPIPIIGCLGIQIGSSIECCCDLYTLRATCIISIWNVCVCVFGYIYDLYLGRVRAREHQTGFLHLNWPPAQHCTQHKHRVLCFPNTHPIIYPSIQPNLVSVAFFFCFRYKSIAVYMVYSMSTRPKIIFSNNIPHKKN